jgi:oxalate---CoA ligase
MPILLDRLGSVTDLGLGQHWDACRLRREAANRSTALSDLGLRSGMIVAIAHGTTAHFFADLLATWRVGAAAACLDPALTDHERAIILGFLQPAAILIDDRPLLTAGDVPQLALADASDADETPSAASPEPSSPALILFTSGTTGAPKGVVLSFGALLARLGLNLAEIGRDTIARTLVTLPTHFGHGLIGNALTPLLAGGEIVLHPLGLPLARNLSTVIDEQRITFLSSVPALWRLALKVGQPPCKGTIKRTHVGSAPLSAALWSDIAAWTGAPVVNCYGMTEAANWIAGASSCQGPVDGLVGRPWGGEAAVQGDDGIRRSAGEGEILVRSPALMSGYLNRPDLTAAALRDGWLHTGDRGTIDEAGSIRLTGRAKEEINRAGLKVQPSEIDMLLETHPAVAEACVFGLEDAVSGEMVAAAVRFVPGAEVDTEALRIWCRQRLRREAVPERWFIVAEIPRTTRGKIDRQMARRHLTGVRGGT